jgi:glycosyltransferase involved in cell wall biosynthesis
MGGIETFITNVLGNLDELRYELSLVVVTKVTNEYDELLLSHHVKVHVLVKSATPNPIQRFRQGLPAFNTYLRTHETDIIHFNLSDSIDLLYVALAKRHGVKARIVHSHNSSVNAQWKRIAHTVCKELVQHTPNYFLACSDAAAKWLFPKDVYKTQNYVTIKNAIDLQKYLFDERTRQRIRNQYKWTDKIVVANVGRFNTQKNHEFLMKIFAKVVERGYDTILVLVGTGELKDKLVNLARCLKITDRVIFWGVSDHVPSLLQGFDIMVMPSLFEGLPFVSIEAQAASLPLLISDNVTREVNLTRYVKFLSLEDGPSAWAAAILDQRNIQRHRDTTELEVAGYDLQSMIRSLDSIYQKIYEEQYAA